MFQALRVSLEDSSRKVRTAALREFGYYCTGSQGEIPEPSTDFSGAEVDDSVEETSMHDSEGEDVNVGEIGHQHDALRSSTQDYIRSS